jgi:AcrR family transcriptional regulator
MTAITRSAKTAKTARAEATRQALLTSARSLFGDKGYAATSVDEVVKHAGVTKGALYHHFKDKDQLFRAVVEAVKLEVTQSAASSYFKAFEGADPLETVHHTCVAVIDAHLDPAVQRITILDARSVLDASVRRELDARYEVALLRGAFRGAMRSGLVDRQPIITLAHVVAGALTEGCALIAEADDKETARAEVVEVISRLLDGLRPRA